MENQTNNLDDNPAVVYDVEEQRIISVNKFILLSILTFGLYGFWWIYKSWRFFQQKEKLDIMPAVRTLFSLFYLYSLMQKILELAKEKGQSGNFSPKLLFIGFIVANLLSRLPDPLWLISIFHFMFLLPPFEALNFAKQNSTGFILIEESSFSKRQTILVIIGGSLWGLVLLGLSSS